MSADLHGLHLNPSPQAPSILYDTANVSLLSRFSDEMSAYRARKQWIEVFHEHFLLDDERDFEIFVCPSTGGAEYLLSCSFSSACGRYAFWRLINKQAPEAEAALHRAPSGKSKKKQKIMADFGPSAEGVAPFLLSERDAISKRLRKTTWYQDLLSSIFKR